MVRRAMRKGTDYNKIYSLDLEISTSVQAIGKGQGRIYNDVVRAFIISFYQRYTSYDYENSANANCKNQIPGLLVRINVLIEMNGAANPTTNPPLQLKLAPVVRK